MKRPTMAAMMILAFLAGGMMSTAYARPARTASGAKYVFFFLGDGLSASQSQATEAYKTVKNGGSAKNPVDLLNPANRLAMSLLPVQGMQTTFDDGALMTDSASSATAFACGLKTKSGIIGKNTAKTLSYKSVAQLAHEAGKSVGILSSVSLDHATPAAYYASVNSRGEMNSICQQLAVTGYEFIGGGGLAGTNNMSNLLTPHGYSIKNTRASILALTNAPVSKVFCVNPWLQDAAAMPYHVDFQHAAAASDNVSLKEMTQVAIACLKNDPQGFFMMVEGGKIDWACHANDAVATMEDVLDFDNAVAEAVAFYNANPNDTLIIVTGDHETGGMTVGHATTQYVEYYSRLTNQVCSFQEFGASVWPAHETANEAGYDYTRTNLVDDACGVAFQAMMLAHFGLNYADLNAFQKQKLEDAYDKSMVEVNDNLAEENSYLYGGYEPIVVTITHILNERASVGWTSYSHTGVPVPVFAIGFDAYRFEGFYDNTDIAKRISAAMRTAVMPVVK
jgi:alkaline phosphatase